MASVQLPSVNLEEQDTGKLLKQLINAYIMLTEELTFLLNNLDTRNINELNAEVIIAKTITADKMLINELSAITANLGHIISGLIESVEIYGSYIATSRDSYPFVELSNTANMMAANKEPGNAIQFFSPNNRLTPVLRFVADGIESYIFYDPTDNTLSVTSNSANINISTLGDIQLYGSNVRLSGWGALRNNGSERTLQQDLDSKSNVGVSTGSAGPYNCGIPIGTQIMAADGEVFTWAGVPQHSHAQR